MLRIQVQSYFCFRDFSVFFRDYSLRFREFSIFCRELSLCRCDFLVSFAVNSYSVSLLVDPVLFS